MTKNQINSFLITPSLINSINYYIQNNLETNLLSKIISILKREAQPITEQISAGISYEDSTYKGCTNASKYVEGGAYQIAKKKFIEVDGVSYLIYGRIDFLKAGTIYDVKYTSSYTRPKYYHNTQTSIYLYLFDSAIRFTYLIADGYENTIYQETYYRDEVPSVYSIVKDFISLLKKLNLYNLYLENWRTKNII